MALFGRKKKVVEPEPPVEPERLPGQPEPDDAGLVSMEAYRDFLLAQVEPLRPFGLSLLDAWDLALCETIESYVDLPGFDNSSMDGYAVAAESVIGASETTPVQLAVVGEVAAGQAPDMPLSPGTAMKIMTGAPMPEGADAVVPFEYTDRGALDVTITQPVQAGDFVRLKGSDVTEGAQVLAEGDRVDARAVGLLAGIGIDKVLVRPRPRVVVIATGNELVQPGLELGRPGQIYDANSYLIAAACRAAGAQVFHVGIVGDDAEVLKQTIVDQLIRADLIISSGGISEGDYDIVKRVTPEVGVTHFLRVAMQPGKPQGFGLMGEDRIPMIMVPGNPVSSYVSFQAFIRPVLNRMMGVEPYVQSSVRAIAKPIIRSRPGVLQLARGLVTDEGSRRMVEPVGGHSSHLLNDLAKANCLILLERDVDVVNPGEPVNVWLLNEH